MKRQLDSDRCPDAEGEISGAFESAFSEQSVTTVPLPLAMQGPGRVTWQLLEAATCTEEQIDAVRART